MKKYKNPSSISPHNKTNSNPKRKNSCELIININESNSTPNMCNLRISKNKNKRLKEEKEKIPHIKTNVNLSPLTKLLCKNNSHKMRNNTILNKNFISRTIKNKMKKTQKEKERKIKNLNMHKITPYSNGKRNILSHTNKNEYLNLSNKAMTISGIKNYSVKQKYNSIKTCKKRTIINSKTKRKSDINNNININININSNNIFNSTNQINNSHNYNLSNSLHNNSTNNSLLNKKKYYELLRQSSSFITKRNDNHRQMLKKMLLSSSSNYNIFNNSKKKNSILNTNTLTFSRCLTSRNSQNSSKIKNKIKKDNKNIIGKMKTNICSYKVKKELFNKKEKVIYSKNKIPIVKSPRKKQ